MTIEDIGPCLEDDVKPFLQVDGSIDVTDGRRVTDVNYAREADSPFVCDEEDLNVPLCSVKSTTGHLTLLSSPAERTNLQKHASKVYKKLPGTPGKRKAAYGLQLMRRLGQSPHSGKFFRRHLTDVFHIPQEKTVSKKQQKLNAVHKLIAALRNHKKKRNFDKVDELTQLLREETGSLKKAAAVVGMNWRTLQSICRIKGKKGYRWITDKQRAAVRDVYERQDISMQLPLKRHARKRFLRVSKDEAYKTYGQIMREKRTRALSRSAVDRILSDDKYKVQAKIPLDTCKCPDCENYSFLVKALVDAGVKGIEERPFENLYNCMCKPKNNDVNYAHPMFKYNIECVQGDCDKCGPAKLLKRKIDSLNTEKFLATTMCKWYQWSKVDRSNKQRFPREEYTDVIHTLLGKFYTLSKHMLVHYFAIKWQADQFEYLQNNLKEGEVLIVMDFAQNFDHIRQNEPQSAHFGRNQSTVHSVVCFYQCPEDPCRNRVRHEMVIFSDDRSHSYKQVAAMEKAVLRKLQEEVGLKIKRIFQYTDNCGKQYKAYGGFDKVSRSVIPICRSYFCPHHGKSVCDGIIGRIKARLARDIKTGKAHCETTEQLFEYCKKHYSTHEPNVHGTCNHVRTEFLLVPETESNKEEDSEMETLAGTMKLHCMRSVGAPGILEYRAFSCFCDYCRSLPNENIPGPCRNEAVVKGFSRTSIDPDSSVNDVNVPDEHWGSSAESTTKKNVKPGKQTPAKGRGRGRGRKNKVGKGKQSGEDDNVSKGQGGQGRGRGRPSKTKPVVPDADRQPLRSSQRRRVTKMPDTILEEVESDREEDVENTEHCDPPVTDVNVELGVPVPACRSFDFGSAAREIAAECDDYWRLYQACKTIYDFMPPLDDGVIVNARVNTDVKDSLSAFLMPAGMVTGGWFAVTVHADGNCLPHTMSRIIYGHEGFHTEMRVRLVCEMIRNREKYLNAAMLAKGHQDPKALKGLDLATYYTTESRFLDNFLDEGPPTNPDVQGMVFDAEIIHMAKSGLDSHIWALHAAANVMRRDIMSVFPDVSEFHERDHPFAVARTIHHRIIEPFEPVVDNQLAFVMWSKSTDDRPVYNHVVPLVK